jgi:hypothetical protein
LDCRLDPASSERNPIRATASFAAEDADADADAAATCGGESFTSGTKVLLARGVAIPISQLKPGDKVEATNTKTGKTQAETVAALLVHHDTDRYDLTVKTAQGSAVIDTTRNHLFWDVTQDKWVRAGKLKYGDTLRTSNGATVTAAGGHAPKQRTGWMWDISVPGSNDHDFYIDTTIATILVHNCDEPGMPSLHAHYPTQEDALNAALHDAGITDPDLAVTNNYDGGSQMLGPNGEPWQSIEGFDDSGEVQEIQFHNAHSFPDGGGFGPHYIDPATGFHSF